MKNFLLIYISLLIISLPASAASQNTATFFETLYDVPVMPGLVEVPEMALSFDKIGGRISEAAAVANADINKNKILAFYEKTLVQMGWLNRSASKGDNIVFTREGESLAISIESLEGDAPAGKLVKFTLKPQ